MMFSIRSEGFNCALGWEYIIFRKAAMAQAFEDGFFVSRTFVPSFRVDDPDIVCPSACLLRVAAFYR